MANNDDWRCVGLDKHNPVRMFCEKAWRQADHNFFYEADRSLEQAKSYIKDDEEKACYGNYQRRIEELREQQIKTLTDSVVEALQRSAIEVNENLNQTVIEALSILQNLIPWSRSQNLLKKWQEHYGTAIQERKKILQKMLDRARRLVKQGQFKEAEQLLEEAKGLADRNGKRNIARLEHEIQQRRLQILSQHLKRAQDLTDQDHFDEALASLREAYKLSSITEGEASLIQAREAEIKEARRGRVQALTEELEKLLSQVPEALAPDDLYRGEDTLAHLQNIHPTPTDLDPLAEDWQTLRRKAEIHLDYQATRQELQQIWNAPYLMLAQYDEALALAGRKAQAYPDELRFKELEAQARARREEAYRKEGDLTTQAAQGHFEATIAEMERLRSEGYTTLPRYSWEKYGLVSTGAVPADEAIEHLTGLAREYEDRKADEYLQRARDALSDNPIEAERWLEAARTFEYLSPAKREAIQHEYEQVVAPARERHQQALELAEAARERRAQDIVAAWQLVQEAYKLAPGLKEVQRIRDYFRPWFVVYVDSQLRQAEEAMWNNDCTKAGQLAQYVLTIIQNSQPLFQEASGKAQHVLERCRREQEGRNNV